MKALKILLPIVVLGACTKDKYQPKGDYGNASIAVSSTYTPAAWTEDFNDGTNFQFTTGISCPIITQAVRDNGAVMVYGLGSNNEWVALPFIDNYTGANPHSFNTSFSFNTGFVILSFSGYDAAGAWSVADLNGAITIRVVAISGAKLLPPELDLRNYHAMQQHFHLPD